MTRSEIPRCRSRLNIAFLIATALAIIAHSAVLTAQADEWSHHYLMSQRFRDMGIGEEIVVSSVAASFNADTGDATGIAAFQYLEPGPNDQHLTIVAEFRSAEASFGDQGDLLAVTLQGIATVTDLRSRTTRAAVLALVSDHDGVRVQLTGDNWELPFQAAPPGEPVAINRPASLDLGIVGAALNVGPNGELDTMALGVIGLSTGNLLGNFHIGVLSTDTGAGPFVAIGDMDRMRIEPEDDGVKIDLRGTSTVFTRDGECVSTSSMSALMPIEDVFSIKGRGTVRVPRCRARMTMSSDDPGVTWVSGIVFR